MSDDITPESRLAARARDAEINRITLDPILPAYGGSNTADQVFNLRSMGPMTVMGFTPDHATVQRSTLRGPHGDIL
jgi:hypothetical protein